MRYIYAHAMLILIFITISCSKNDVEGKDMVVINKDYKGMPCEVYFFESWSTYQHPVTPTGPLQYEDALGRKGFYRAWMCKKNNSDYFVFFEGVENSIELSDRKLPDDASNELQFYEFTNKGGVGRKILVNDTLDKEFFYVSLPNENSYLSLVKQKKGISYEYIYNSSGLLEKAIITDFDGNVKTLDM